MDWPKLADPLDTNVILRYLVEDPQTPDSRFSGVVAFFEKLRELLSFKGLRVPEKPVLRACLETLSEQSVDLVDAYLAALCIQKRLAGVYSFDKGLTRLGVDLLPVE